MYSRRYGTLNWDLLIPVGLMIGLGLNIFVLSKSQHFESPLFFKYFDLRLKRMIAEEKNRISKLKE
jgi:hypothetical protein